MIYILLLTNEKIYLDFIYGYIDNKIFYTLDGQQDWQLYLLHLYLAERKEINRLNSRR